MDVDRDPPTQPGRAVASNRKGAMQVVATIAALVVAGIAAWAGVLTEPVVLGVLAVMGLTGAGAQAGNVGEHMAKALPGIAEGIARALRGGR